MSPTTRGKRVSSMRTPSVGLTKNAGERTALAARAIIGRRAPTLGATTDARRRRHPYAPPVVAPRGAPMIRFDRLPSLVAAIGAATVLSLAGTAKAQTKWDLPAAYPANNFHTENLQ